jgi:hypothetical protein
MISVFNPIGYSIMKEGSSHILYRPGVKGCDHYTRRRLSLRRQWGEGGSHDA